MKKLTTATISLIVIALLLVGAGAYYMFGHGVYSKTPMLYGTDTPDGIVKGYLEIMIPRNIEVVEASQKIMQDPDITIPEVRLLAARIADAQEFEIGQMKSWYVDWFQTPVPLFLYQKKMTPIESTGDAVARTYLADLIVHLEADLAETKQARLYIQAIQDNTSSSDGQLTITNSHPGIDMTLMFTEITEEKRSALIGEIQDLLEKLK